jgi:polyhydroxyalkanoate synthase
MLAGSGHIAGVVNPPSAKKYQHWLNETAKNPPTLDEWRAGATEHPGSWWNDWDKWLSEKSGTKVPARVPATAAYRRSRTHRAAGTTADRQASPWRAASW